MTETDNISIHKISHEGFANEITEPSAITDLLNDMAEKTTYVEAKFPTDEIHMDPLPVLSSRELAPLTCDNQYSAYFGRGVYANHIACVDMERVMVCGNCPHAIPVPGHRNAKLRMAMARSFPNSIEGSV